MSFVGSQDNSPFPGAVISLASPGDYFSLLKPRVMSLVVFTALAGLLIAPGHVNVVLGFAAIVAIAVGAGAAGALNMWYDAEVDALMGRTRERAIPAGQVAPGEALVFGSVLAFLSVLTLGLVANWFAAALLAFTIFFYLVVYTMWLKRVTPQNIVIGGAAGAIPPVIGYVVATNHASLNSLVLFAIIFLWTPPHFWALAILKTKEYARAGIPMMPNVKGIPRTRLEVLLYTLVLAPVGVLPWIMGFAGLAYGVVAVVAGLLMLWFAWRVYRVREGEAAVVAAKQLFGFSILYLMLLFAVLVAEYGLGVAARYGL